MSFFIITLVSSQTPLTPDHVDRAARTFSGTGTPGWLAEGKAADIPVPLRPDKARLEELRALLATDKIDVLVTPSEGRRKKLLLSDMDATIVREETLDELAAHAGPTVQAQIAEMTLRTMRGEIDFESALRLRLHLLKGLTDTALEQTRRAATLMPGALELVRTMRRHGALCVLITGGFTYFSSYIAERVGFDRHHANVFGMAGGELTGEVEGKILDKAAKRDFLHAYTKERHLSLTETMAIGDGSNDLPMLEDAGLGIGYHPKPLLRERLDNCILYGDLTAALYAQGYRAQDFYTGDLPS